MSTFSTDLWNELVKADQEADILSVSKLILKLLVHDERIHSLADIELALRLANFTSRLVAYDTPKNATSRNPLKSCFSNCQRYVSVNMEGKKSAQQSLAYMGIDDEENLKRLDNECGFLVLEKTSMLAEVDGMVQLVDTNDFSNDQFCVSCKRLRRDTFDLKPLDCCTAFCCSSACWRLHVKLVHNCEF